MTQVLPAGKGQSQDLSQSPALSTMCGSLARACGGGNPTWHSNGDSGVRVPKTTVPTSPYGVLGGCFVPPARSLWVPECALLGLRTREPWKVWEQVCPAHAVCFMELTVWLQC